jgi:hypothetical protein
MYQSKPEPTLGELFSDLTREIGTLVRQEVTLATTEMSQKASRVGRGVGILALGGFVAYAGLLAIVAAVIIVLANVMPWWLAALVVGLVVAGIGYVLVQRGLTALKETNLAPTATITTIREDLEWAKDQTK